MQQKNFSFLLEHFGYETFELGSGHRFVEPVLIDCQKRKFDPDGYNFINAFYEKNTDQMITFEISTEDDFNNDRFEFYLKQLPSLSLSDGKYMFALNKSDLQLLPNAFKLPVDYPSEFCKEFLKETYGRVVYSWQFVQLVTSCLENEDYTINQVDEYCRWYNQRMAKVFPIIENLYLPDNYSLDQLLRKFTPLSAVDSDYGFVIRPNVSYIWDFIQRAKKYI